jgi:hypothetical protein
MKLSISPSELCKTGQITPYRSFEKSQKIHKMENQIVLDFKWVDLPNEQIIWNALV